ncbi:tRNA adenosine(34) deaminase TadA [Pseudoclavibacter sp. 13-3]|uniref:tRNA adenosine(34) deaminase TadA n=1 Tax=Pseudoclavibacter sp. 13-3 TaxID=2901228 RepID=UPI001E483ECA|nr:tRNA adenosine(34) deaminase TadA [Pseudoclavibacter sp. 13-3]MCD7101647.1 tRNA adenosine(34) deaminase TadA [Pseudoclavibacter sp. 13-3]
MPVSPVFEQWMDAALEESHGALETGDVPVGAIMLDALGNVISVAHNEREKLQDPTAHAEVLAIRRAAKAWGSWQLPNTTLVVTLEPCVLCAGAILSARIPRVIFGAWDDKAGAAGSVYDLLRDRRLNHQVEVIGGVCERRSSGLLQDFFQPRR